MSSSNYAYQIAFYEAFEEEADKIKYYLPDPSIAFFTEKTIQDEGHESLIAPVISVRTQSIIPLGWASNIDAIISRSTGYDHLHRYKRETNVDVPAGNLPLYCSRAVAEQCMLLWMSLLRKLPQQVTALQQFERNFLTGGEAKGRNIAVIGIGQIGYEVVDIARGLGMNVAAVDVVERYSDIVYSSLDKALDDAEIIVCSMNLTTDNCSYFNAELWKTVRSGAIFVNISRGEISPLKDLQEALELGYLSGVALDVYNEESNIAGFLRDTSYIDNDELDAFKKLHRHPNVIMTPHNAFNTEEAVDKKAEQSVQQFLSWIKNGRLCWMV